ncbi:hypothetical protein D9M68_368190 [compost metagenome]
METTDAVSGMHGFTMLQRRQITNGDARTLPYFETFGKHAPVRAAAAVGRPLEPVAS